MVKLTIFTPTYNRAILLKQLYESLLKQGNRDFEWLIIDDGSSDDTNQVVNTFIEENKILIRYYTQKNGGKHRAFNQAIILSNAEIFICVDSDDFLVENAVQTIIEEYDKVKLDQNICGIAGLCQDKSGQILGGRYFRDNLISNTMEIRDKYNRPGEPEIYKTNILKNYSFKEFEGEKFITEAVLFDQIAAKYNMKYINQVLMVKEYLPGGLTDNQLKIRIDNINGTKHYYNQRIKLSNYLSGKLRAVINYSRFCLHGKSEADIFKSNSIFLSFVSFPIAFIMYVNDKNNMNKKYNTK